MAPGRSSGEIQYFDFNKRRDALRASASLHCSVVSVVGNGYWVGFDKHGGSAGYHSETRIAGWINIATAGTS